jgi:predicted RND superfamily exporter protein
MIKKKIKKLTEPFRPIIKKYYFSKKTVSFSVKKKNVIMPVGDQINPPKVTAYKELKETVKSAGALSQSSVPSLFPQKKNLKRVIKVKIPQKSHTLLASYTNRSVQCISFIIYTNTAFVQRNIVFAGVVICVKLLFQ